MPATTLHRRPTRAAPPLTPTRRRLILGWAALAVALLTAALIGGLVLAFSGPQRQAATANSPGLTQPTPRSAPVTDQQRMNALAASPMSTLPLAAANPHALLPHTALAPLSVPTSTTVRGLVPTGFPRTPAGAVAQLAAIDEAALSGMNPSQVAQVYADWAVAAADPLDLWSVHQFVQQTLNASGIPNGSSQLQATYSATEAQVKGTVGAGFVLACINGEFDVSLLDNTVRVGAADCARMVWTGSRWQIGAGTQPATPPNAWPGTAEAAQVGWRPIVDD